MELEQLYDAKEGIPAGMEGLYTEKEGKWHLTGIKGMKTQADIDNVKATLDKERKNSSDWEKKAQKWARFGEDADPEDIEKRLASIPELEKAAEGKIDKEELEKMADERVAKVRGPLENQLKEANEKLATTIQERDAAVTGLANKEKQDVIRVAAVEMNVVQTAIPDVEVMLMNYIEKEEGTGKFVVKADSPVGTPGSDAKSLIKDHETLKPHWFERSDGGGAGGGNKGGGSDGENPWTREHWNKTEQGKYIKEHGIEKATAAAKSAGSSLDAFQPPVKK